MNGSPLRFLQVGLQAPEALLPELGAFYRDLLGLQGAPARPSGLAVLVGESTLAFEAVAGRAFYHVALLAPGDRFEAAHGWIASHVRLLPGRSGDDGVFDFVNWDARGCYFHDPAGNILELIAHRGIGDAG